ncbi:MAG: DUF4160 domain-containing protein [Caulobacterales bacterium]|nr:DUF4160 domain-containing protein [Caulobacterales bacterium]
MPIVSIFFGIVIRINFYDHNPPHLHAEHGGREGVFDIRTGSLMEGAIPRTATRRVQLWISMHREALLANWDLAYKGEQFLKIPGLEP